jgi:hypothetical protein
VVGGGGLVGGPLAPVSAAWMGSRRSSGTRSSGGTCSPPRQLLATRLAQPRRVAPTDCARRREGPGAGSRFAVRWLRRLLEEDESLAIEEAVAASCLSALGGSSHEEAVGMLLAMAERATRQGRERRVAS